MSRGHTKKDTLDDDKVKSYSNNTVKEFIQHISILPYKSCTGMKQVFVFGTNWPREALCPGMLLDLSFERKEKTFLYYELTVANPVKGEPPIHVSAMTSSSHDTLQIHSWFR